MTRSTARDTTTPRTVTPSAASAATTTATATATSTTAVRRDTPSPARGPIHLLPGVLAAATITVVATVLGDRVPVVGAPVFAITVGILVAVLRPPHPSLGPGIGFVSKRVLQGSIVVLGFGLSVDRVMRVGAESLPVLLGSLIATLTVAWLAGRWLRIRRDTNLLIGVGTAICGASAIAATNAVIDADEADVSYSIATIFLFNVLAVLSFPAIGHALGMSQDSFGLWAGTAVNDTSSVVAASNVYGSAAMSYGVVVKLTRTLAIVPITIGVAWLRSRKDDAGTDSPSIDAAERGPGQAPTGSAEAARDRPAPRSVPLRRVLPLFILGFLAAVVVNSLGWVPDRLDVPLARSATWMITASLAAIGLSTRVRDIRTAGFRPVLLGAILWVSVAITTLGLQALTGTL